MRKFVQSTRLARIYLLANTRPNVYRPTPIRTIAHTFPRLHDDDSKLESWQLEIVQQARRDEYSGNVENF